jgi:hypothetical protein
MRTSMNGLQPENRSLLIAMLNAPPGAVGLDRADAQLRDYLGTAPVSSTEKLIEMIDDLLEAAHDGVPQGIPCGTMPAKRRTPSVPSASGSACGTAMDTRTRRTAALPLTVIRGKTQGWRARIAGKPDQSQV